MSEYKIRIRFLIISAVVIILILIVFLYREVLIYRYPQGPEEDEETFYTEKVLKERIGQMMLIGFRGTEISEDSYIAKAINDLKIGGVILFDYDVPSKSFPRNILNPEQTKKLISDLQKFSSTPLFIAVDAEGGKINRLKPEYGFLSIMSPKELGEIGDYEITREEALKLSQELNNLGFNMNLAPVLDVNINSNNPVIGALNRSFSADPQIVALHAQAFIEAHNQNDVITVAKHFPGHGSSLGDSHLGMVDVTETYKDTEMIPYRTLQEKSLLTTVMTAHIFNKKIDENYPATLSSNFLLDILRKQIGFSGVIISDDMQMEAITQYYGMEEAVIKAINSGCDILLFSNNSSAGFDEELPYKIQNIIYQAIEKGKISKERIIEASNRIYNLKRQFKIIQ